MHGSHITARKPARLSLKIDAALAFGSGSHPTTAGCLAALQHIGKRQKPGSVLDLGCGSAILAMAAARLWPAARLTASDIDPDSISTARDNLRQNRISQARCQLVLANGLRHRQLRAGAPYQLVLANILAAPLRRMAPAIASVLAGNGWLVLAGLLDHQARAVLAAYRAQGLVPVWQQGSGGLVYPDFAPGWQTGKRQGGSDEQLCPASGAAAPADKGGRAGRVCAGSGRCVSGEEVRPCDERLAWMTGFDGSAGTAVILADKAALFSDSRYSLQLERQLDSTLWQGFDTAEKGLADWLAAQAAPARLTPWLCQRDHHPARLRRWQKISGRLDWQALPAHPVDPIWTDRPAPAPRAVWQVPDHLAGQTAAEKLAALREKMAAGGAQAQLVTDPMAVNWLFNLRGNDLAHTPVHLCFALIPEQGQPVLIGAEAGAASLAGAEGVALSDAGKMLASLSGQKLALDRASCPLLIADLASSSGAEIVWQEDPLIGMKACKNSAELAGFHAAHLQDALAFVTFWHWLEQQNLARFTESQLADQLQQYRAAKPGYICDSFPAIVGFAENAAVVHYRARPGQDRQITADNLLLIDSGGHYQQGTTDITRTLAIGSPPAEAVAAASSVLAGHCELARARFPAQSSGAQLDALARAPLWEKQLDYGHGTGHGVGHILSVHEGPASLSPRSDKPVQAGMVLSMSLAITSLAVLACVRKIWLRLSRLMRVGSSWLP